MNDFDKQVQAEMNVKTEQTLDDVFEFIRSVYGFVIPEEKEAGELAFNTTDYYGMEALAACVKQNAAELKRLQAVEAEARIAIKHAVIYSNVEDAYLCSACYQDEKHLEECSVGKLAALLGGEK